jgi:hypothetical protein
MIESELEWTWKEAVMANLKFIPTFTWRYSEKPPIFSQDVWYHDWHSNLEPSNISKKVTLCVNFHAFCLEDGDSLILRNVRKPFYNTMWYHLPRMKIIFMDMHIISYPTKFHVTSVINNLKIKSKFRALIITVLCYIKMLLIFCVSVTSTSYPHGYHTGVDWTDLKNVIRLSPAAWPTESVLNRSWK